MGCDIHAFIEYVYEGEAYTNTFSYDEITSFGRDYNLFSLIAGVRGATPPVVFPRGFPCDLVRNGNIEIFDNNYAVAKKYEEYGKDAHSATWLTLDELKLVRVEYIKEKFEFDGITDPNQWGMIRNKNVANSIFTYNFGEHENCGLYMSIVIMESLHKLYPNIKTRFCCWFDS